MRWLLWWWRWLTERHRNPHPLSNHRPEDRGGMPWWSDDDE